MYIPDLPTYLVFYLEITHGSSIDTPTTTTVTHFKSFYIPDEESCITKGFTNQVTTVVKGETPPTTSYPSHHCLIANCKMKPSLRLYYQVKGLHFDNVVIFIVMSYELYLIDAELANLKSLNKMYRKMIDNILRLQSVDFLSLK
jgi:hypothetical protein